MVKSEDTSDVEDSVSKMDDSFQSTTSSSPSSSASSTSSPEIDVGDDQQQAAKRSRSPPKLPFRPLVSCPTVPASLEPAAMPSGGFFNPFLDPKSLVEAYAARLHSEADYARLLQS